MKRFENVRHSLVRIVATAMFMAVMPMLLHGQEAMEVKELVEGLSTSVKNLDKIDGKLKDMATWQEKLENYQKSQTELDSLKKIKSQKNNHFGELVERNEEIHGLLQSLFFERKGKERPFKQMYAEYDTCMLLLVSGHIGDSICEKIVESLLTCHRAESLLALPYDKASAEGTRQALNKVKNKFNSDVVADIADRLGQYRSMTNRLGEVLHSADSLIMNADITDGDIVKDRDRETFCSELEKNLNPKMLDPNAYPYLYGIMMEALEAKLEEPSNDITKIKETLKQLCL